MDFLRKLKAFIKGKPTYDVKKAIEEKRYSPRIKCFIEAKCLSQDKRERNVIINEVSLTGMRLFCEEKLEAGDILTFKVIKADEVFKETERVGGSVDAKVVWSRKKRSTKEYVSGLQYDDSKENLKDSWVAFLFKKFGISVGLSNQQRKRVRFQTEIPLSVALTATSFPGIVMDMGIGGMLIATDKDIRKAPLLHFRIGPYKHLEILFCDGKVVHHQFNPEVKKWNFGILFVELPEKQNKLLNEYLTALCLEEKEPI